MQSTGGLISRVSSRTYRHNKNPKNVRGPTLRPRCLYRLQPRPQNPIHEPSHRQARGSQRRSRVQWYLGKRVAFVHKAAKNTKIVDGKKPRSRVIWGRVMRPHGQSGNVKVKFNSNLPSAQIAKKVRVMLY